jgi:DNA-binding response OmpR family regulator
VTRCEGLAPNAQTGNVEALPRVLVAEDEYLLAVMLEDDLRANGFVVVGPFTRLEEANAAASAEEFDIALLDVNMNGKMAYSIADVLIERGIPFIFLSGYGRAMLPEHLRHSRCFPKPYEPSVLIEEVKRLVAERPGP